MSSFDAIPRREPAFSAPAIVLLLIAVLVAVHAVRTYVLEDDIRILLDYSFIPARLSLWYDAEALAAHLRRTMASLSGEDGARTMALAAHLFREDAVRWWTLVSYAGLHGSWTHVLVNSVWLLAFATPVARRVGPFATVVLYIATAAGGALLHWGLHPYDVTPMVGASAIASGVMGAASRFMFHSSAVVAFGDGGAQAKVQGLREIVRNRRAMLFIGIWMISNILFGVLAKPLGIADGGIAWEAHIGGFVAGFLLMPILARAANGR